MNFVGNLLFCQLSKKVVFLNCITNKLFGTENWILDFQYFNLIIPGGFCVLLEDRFLLKLRRFWKFYLSISIFKMILCVPNNVY